MRESRWRSLLLLVCCACTPAPPPPPSAPTTTVPVASVAASPVVEEPVPALRPSEPAEPRDTVEAPNDDGPPPVPPASGTPPFDRGRAAAALGGVTVSTCARVNGPNGPGHVRITFGTDGRARAVVLDQGAFMGTPVGSCIAARFRGVSVPPFSGADVTVGKSFFLK